MNLTKHIEIVKRMDDLIRRKATGCPNCFSNKMGFSKATLHRYLVELKSFGAPIIYSRSLESYYYEEDFELVF